MKKYSVCAIVDNFTYQTFIVMADDISVIMDKYDNPTDTMMKIIKKEGFEYPKEDIFLDVVCIEPDEILAPYIIND